MNDDLSLSTPSPRIAKKVALATAAISMGAPDAPAEKSRRPGHTSEHLSPPSAPQVASLSRIWDFIALMKPRVMSLAVFTAFVGMMLAPGQLAAPGYAVALLAIAGGAGAAGMLNMWYDADIDAEMARTANRPIPQGKISRSAAFAVGLILASASTATLCIWTNIAAAALLAFAIFFYVVVYTIWLKRRTSQNIVIGGLAGALPPAIGWFAGGGALGPEPIILTLIIFLWTPPHFWALALNRAGEYQRAGVPMLPVVAGKQATASQVLLYSVALSFVSVLPWALGFAGALYAATAIGAGAIFTTLALRLRLAGGADRKLASRLFGFSIAYLFLLFTALLIEGGAT